MLDEDSGSAFRASVFINPEGIIVSKLVYPKEMGRNIDEHMRLLNGLVYVAQTGKILPANWKPGNVGIKPDQQNIGKT